MSELWSSQQHEWLTALGHILYVPGSAEPPAVAAKPAVAVATRPSPAVQPAVQPVATSPAPPRRVQHAVETAPVRPAHAPRRAASRLPDKLHFALIRASGCDPSTEEAAAVIAQWPASAELRGNPAAKRALWPQLRALRRRSQ